MKIFLKFSSPALKLYTAQNLLFNDIFIATDSGDCVILVLLDLTAAFDTVDHEITCLEWWA